MKYDSDKRTIQAEDGAWLTNGNGIFVKTAFLATGITDVDNSGWKDASEEDKTAYEEDRKEIEKEEREKATETKEENQNKFYKK
ncbi:MAG: hypothetical protein LKK19_01855 [Bacteroidales bacterium]|jgi:hypothetical protein|nr:hypothetical protein [Bacteroidales bacterium]MCI2145855.1 hypothetical protein [Bacteroidales bacterium]